MAKRPSVGERTATALRSAERSAHAPLRRKVDDRTAVLAFVGLGYVGLPVCLSFAAKGFSVRTHDINPSRVSAVAEGIVPLGGSEPGLRALLDAVLPTGRLSVSAEPDVLAGCDIYFLATDTPILADYSFDAPRFMRGVKKIGAYVLRDTMVVVESTVPPGTMEDLVIPTLEASSGLRAGHDFLVVHCPERLRPGKLLHNLTTLTRLVGADSEATRALAASLYAYIVDAPLRHVDYRTAEVVKTAENAARDVQIALADQLAVVCDVVGADFHLVRDAVNELWRDEPLVLEAGPGVGGHCLPKDPWLLVSTLPEGDMRALVAGARAMNSFMPRHVASIAIAMLGAEGVRPTDATVSVLGISYNANTDDTRNSPGLAISEILRARGANVSLHDPHVAQHGGDPVEALRGSDLAILINAHTEYRRLDWTSVRAAMRHGAILDTRRFLSAGQMRSMGFTYRALGVGALRPSSA